MDSVVEIITGHERRRRFGMAEKLRLVAEQAAERRALAKAGAQFQIKGR